MYNDNFEDTTTEEDEIGDDASSDKMEAKVNKTDDSTANRIEVKLEAILDLLKTIMPETLLKIEQTASKLEELVKKQLEISKYSTKFSTENNEDEAALQRTSSFISYPSNFPEENVFICFLIYLNYFTFPTVFLQLVRNLIKSGNYRISDDSFRDDEERQKFVNDIVMQLKAFDIEFSEKSVRNMTNYIVRMLPGEDSVRI